MVALLLLIIRISIYYYQFFGLINYPVLKNRFQIEPIPNNPINTPVTHLASDGK